MVWLFPIEVGCRGFPAQSVWAASGRQPCAGWERQQKEPLVGFGPGGRRMAGGLELMGSDLSSTADPPAGGCCG